MHRTLSTKATKYIPDQLAVNSRGSHKPCLRAGYLFPGVIGMLHRPEAKTARTGWCWYGLCVCQKDFRGTRSLCIYTLNQSRPRRHPPVNLGGRVNHVVGRLLPSQPLPGRRRSDGALVLGGTTDLEHLRNRGAGPRRCTNVGLGPGLGRAGQSSSYSGVDIPSVHPSTCNERVWHSKLFSSKGRRARLVPISRTNCAVTTVYESY